MRWVQVLGFDASSDAYDTALVGIEVVDTNLNGVLDAGDLVGLSFDGLALDGHVLILGDLGAAFDDLSRRTALRPAGDAAAAAPVRRPPVPASRRHVTLRRFAVPCPVEADPGGRRVRTRPLGRRDRGPAAAG